MSKERNAPFMPDRLQPRSAFDHIGFHVADGQADVKSIERAEVLDDMLKIFADIPDRCAVLFRTCQNRIIEQTLLSRVDRTSKRQNSSHNCAYRMPSSV